MRELLRLGEATGAELIDKSRQKINGKGIYAMLHRMEERQLVKSRIDIKAVHPGLPRPRYTVTDFGKKVVNAWADFLKDVSAVGISL